MEKTEYIFRRVCPFNVQAIIDAEEGEVFVPEDVV